MDFGDPTIRSLDEIVKAFDPTMVQWLFVLLILEFITGVALAIKENVFDWDRVFDIAKKNVWYALGWGVAFIYSETAGNTVYALIMAAIGGGLVSNLTSLLGTTPTGILGQIVNKGPGDGK